MAIDFFEQVNRFTKNQQQFLIGQFVQQLAQRLLFQREKDA